MQTDFHSEHQFSTVLAGSFRYVHKQIDRAIERMMADDVMQIDMAIARLSAGPQTPQAQTQIAQWQAAKQRLQSLVGDVR